MRSGRLLTLGRLALRGMPRPRLLVLNQYYWPGVEATAHLLTELCEALAEDIRRDGRHGHPARPRGRAAASRSRTASRSSACRSTSFERSQLSRRARELRHVPRRVAPQRRCACPSPGRRALHDRSADRRRHRPDRRAALRRAARRDQPGRLSRDRGASSGGSRIPLLVGVLRGARPLYLAARRPRRRDRRDDAATARGEGRRRRSVSRVIPNWVDTTRITPQPRDNAWAREHGLVGQFVVMHSGNVGHAQDLDIARPRGDVPARSRRPGDRDHRHRRPARGARSRSPSARGRHRPFLPYQPRERAAAVARRPPTSTSSVSRRGLPGYIVPSRLYGILAVGTPGDRRRRRRRARQRSSSPRSAAASSFRPAVPSCSRARSVTRTRPSSTSRRWARADVRGWSARPTVTSPSAATATSCSSLRRSYVAAGLIAALALVAGWNTYKYPSGSGYDVRQHREYADPSDSPRRDPRVRKRGASTTRRRSSTRSPARRPTSASRCTRRSPTSSARS